MNDELRITSDDLRMNYDSGRVVLRVAQFAT